MSLVQEESGAPAGQPPAVRELSGRPAPGHRPADRRGSERRGPERRASERRGSDRRGSERRGSERRGSQRLGSGQWAAGRRGSGRWPAVRRVFGRWPAVRRVVGRWPAARRVFGWWPDVRRVFGRWDSGRPAQRSAVRRALYEIALVVLLFLAYKAGRLAADGHVTMALADARDVWHLERLLHLPSEFALQQAALSHEWLIRSANCYYAYVHFPVTAACLVWIYVRRAEHYLRTRRLLAWLTAGALIVHVVMPLAPPRMLTAVGMVDSGRLFGPAVYGSPSTDTLTNQYAAMPSLHVGWALAVAIALIGATGGRGRWLWLAHPAATLLVVVVTGNHYWLDAIVAAALLGVVLVCQSSWRPVVVLAMPRPRASEG
jgi:hypothetical protein